MSSTHCMVLHRKRILIFTCDFSLLYLASTTDPVTIQFYPYSLPRLSTNPNPLFNQICF
nr:hypothetical protein Q903MT_gene3552 [Picea sitchensis]